MFYKKIIIGLFLSAVHVLSATIELPRNVPQPGRQQSCRNCWEILNSCQIIINKFSRHDTTQYFIQIQSQLGEALRKPCACHVRNRITDYLREKLELTWDRVSPGVIQELRAHGELYCDISQR